MSTTAVIIVVIVIVILVAVLGLLCHRMLQKHLQHSKQQGGGKHKYALWIGFYSNDTTFSEHRPRNGSTGMMDPELIPTYVALPQNLNAMNKLISISNGESNTLEQPNEYKYVNIYDDIFNFDPLKFNDKGQHTYYPLFACDGPMIHQLSEENQPLSVFTSDPGPEFREMYFHIPMWMLPNGYDSLLAPLSTWSPFTSYVTLDNDGLFITSRDIMTNSFNVVFNYNYEHVKNDVEVICISTMIINGILREDTSKLPELINNWIIALRKHFPNIRYVGIADVYRRNKVFRPGVFKLGQHELEGYSYLMLDIYRVTSSGVNLGQPCDIQHNGWTKNEMTQIYDTLPESRPPIEQYLNDWENEDLTPGMIQDILNAWYNQPGLPFSQFYDNCMRPIRKSS